MEGFYAILGVGFEVEVPPFDFTQASFLAKEARSGASGDFPVQAEASASVKPCRELVSWAK